MSPTNNFWSLKTKHHRIVIFFRTIEIKVGIWNLTIYNGNMFLFNVVYESFLPSLS